jgi:hypothetical protein
MGLDVEMDAVGKVRYRLPKRACVLMIVCRPFLVIRISDTFLVQNKCTSAGIPIAVAKQVRVHPYRFHWSENENG